MTLRNCFTGFAALALVACGSLTASAGTFSLANLVIPSGTTPNGTSWSTLSSGTSPVAYFNISTGELQLDPKGRDISGFSFKYGSTVSGTTAASGPFTYTQTGANAVGVTFPAGSYSFAPTTNKGELGAAFYTLTNPTSASTNGYFNGQWNFGAVAPSVTTQALVYSSTAGQGFRSTGAVNLLGYGNGIDMFSYTVNGVAGTSYGAVIPVQAVPEPSTLVLAGLGISAAGYASLRRRQARAAARVTA